MSQGGRLNGLDLFSGIGGNTLGLREFVKTIAYCERDRYAQSVLLSRMGDGGIEPAPIWDDITSLSAGELDLPVDIIVGGFPCQDISVAGHGKGLDGERSGLYFEVERLARELAPSFVFLENVPAIRTRGGERVGKGLASLGYDCRWAVVSAADVGAPHLRKRWFMLAAHTERLGLRDGHGRSSRPDGQGAAFTVHDGQEEPVAHARSGRRGEQGAGQMEQSRRAEAERSRNAVAYADGERLAGTGAEPAHRFNREPPEAGRTWWTTEPNVGRVAHGVPQRVDRIRCLGNAVVPAQARKAFCHLMGLE